MSEEVRHTQDTQEEEVVEEFARDDVISEIDSEARERLDMSYDDFRQAYLEGTLPDTSAVNELVILLRFAGLGRTT